MQRINPLTNQELSKLREDYAWRGEDLRLKGFPGYLNEEYMIATIDVLAIQCKQYRDAGLFLRQVLIEGVPLDDKMDWVDAILGSSPVILPEVREEIGIEQPES